MLDLSRLSTEQRRVVVAGDGPLLVLAGPGSGKTTVLAARIAYLVTVRCVGPASILAIAFTTGAARELRARLLTLLGDEGRRVDVTTFHGLGLRIVRHWSEQLGFRPGPLAVYGAGDANRLLGEAAEELGVDAVRWPPPMLAAAVERWRLTAEAAGPVDEPVPSVACAYEALLRRRNAVDFPAMLSWPLRLFREHPSALRLHQTAYRAVLCDEAQDVCAAQYELLRLLADRHRNLTLVGDPFQAVYAFRGADARYMRAFVRDFPGAGVLGLTQNFRSTGSILALANALGATLGPPRRLWTTGPPGLVPIVHGAADEADEAAFVAEEIRRLRRDGTLRMFGDAAVLCRTNRQIEVLAIAFRARGLAYHVAAGTDPFGRREIRDALAYMRLAHNPEDAAALARIVNVPPRRLGRVAERLRARPVPIRELPAVAREIGRAAFAAAESVVALVDELHASAARLAPPAALELVLERTGYRDWLDRQADGPSRVVHLDGLRALAAVADGDLGTWLAELAVGEGSATGDDRDRVHLATVHSAKGGEWPVVFLPGVEEGLLPHARALAAAAPEDGGVDEERRIAYVAVTRPRERLYVTYCRERRWGERTRPREPSRFLRELPADLLRAAA